MNRIITLTTDFGTSDGYVGTMKGVILSINPEATIVDITHEIAPQNIEQGAFLFSASYKYFPANTIHVVVVDPGVGTTRRAIAVQSGETMFVAPDNGILPLVFTSSPERLPWSHRILLSHIPPPQSIPYAYSYLNLAPRLMADRTVHLNKPEYWLPKISRTFQGRDVFAPCAAHLSLGVPIEALGDPISSRHWGGPPLLARRVSDTVSGRVVHIDRFGNAVTTIDERTLGGMDRERMLITMRDRQLRGLRQTYSDVEKGEALALIGSFERLEIAVRDGNAAQSLQIRFGDSVVVSLGAE
jgi:S-adenosyl-L-methionine hydrolase (adenosine-forming)